MKKNHILYALTALTLSLSIISCSTTGASAQANVASSEETASGEGTSLGGKTAYATYLGNFDPIKLPEVMSLHMSFKKLAARDLSRNYLVPRTNKVEIYFRDNINAFCLILPEAARHAIIDAANKFVADQEAGTIEIQSPLTRMPMQLQHVICGGELEVLFMEQKTQSCASIASLWMTRLIWS